VALVALAFSVTVFILTSFRVTLAHLIALFFLTGIFAFVVAFALGLDSAKSYRKSEIYNHTVTPLQGAAIKAKIVRSGDRGLLFYNGDTKALVLLPWTQIKEVSSAP
jgi:hypothetical protein